MTQDNEITLSGSCPIKMAILALEDVSKKIENGECGRIEAIQIQFHLPEDVSRDNEFSNKITDLNVDLLPLEDAVTLDDIDNSRSLQAILKAVYAGCSDIVQIDDWIRQNTPSVDPKSIETCLFHLYRNEVLTQHYQVAFDWDEIDWIC